MSVLTLPAAADNARGLDAPQATTGERGAASDEPVEVVSERTAYSTTFANPDGTFTLKQSAIPQRVRDKGGAWRDIDTTLERRADGSIAPKAAVVDLSFSGGGSGKGLIHLGSKQGSLSFNWVNSLPKPALDGPTATYPEVLKGVDLQLTATPEGYREVLVVKTAEAAANPALNQVAMSVSGDGLTVAPGAGGGLRAVDEDGNSVFGGPAGLIWDSAGESKPAARQLVRAAVAGAVEPGTDSLPESAHPDDGDASAVMPVQIQGNSVSVKPDLALLRGKETVYPVYIDPSVGAQLTERTVLSSDGDRFYNFDGDSYGVGHCSRSGPYYCTVGANYTNRMYFQFAPGSLIGKYVLNASFRAYETWSFDCNPHWLELWRTDNISEGSRWPGPAARDMMGDRNVSAGRGDNCSPAQPDSWVEFSDNPAESNENLTPTVRSFAEGRFSKLTFMLRAADEGDASAWKRFTKSATLQVTYAVNPGFPTRFGVIPGDGTTVYCSTNPLNPTVVTRTDPLVQAAVEANTQPASGESRGSLRGHMVVERPDGKGGWTYHWSVYTPDSGYDADGTVRSKRTVSLTDGVTYRMRARTLSYYFPDSRTEYLPGSFTPNCYFRIDATAPKAPRITLGEHSEYTQCGEVCEGKGRPGQAGEFMLAPNAADKDIKGYRWRLLSERSAHEESGSSVTIQPVPTLSGTQVLTVEAKDVRDRWGTPSEFAFKVAPTPGPVGRWSFADGIPGSTITTAVDSATEGIRHPATLHPNAGNTAATWSVMGRRGTDDYSLRLNDDVTDPAKQTGYAATDAPVLNTKSSFTVSAWAFLTDASKTSVVVSAPGNYGSAFHLYYSAGLKRWAFNRIAADAPNIDYVRALGNTENPPINVWTHLAGVFDDKGDTDPKNDTIQLFVNGRPQGNPVNLYQANPAYTPTVSTEGTLFGRSKLGEYFTGRIDEVAAWQTALTPDAVRGDSALAQEGVPLTELVGYWDAGSAVSGKVPQKAPYPAGGMALSATGTATDPDEPAVSLDGQAGFLSTSGPVVDETGSFTVTAKVKLDKAKLDSKPLGYRAQVFGQAAATGSESSWSLWVEKIDPDKDGVASYLWRFGRTATDANGKVIGTASVPSENEAVLDTWVQVTGVFDGTEESEAGFGKTHLYIGATDQAADGQSAFAIPGQGNGVLASGRGSAGGTSGYYLPGKVGELRVWTGAMSAEQVNTKVLGTPGAE
ncbi:LamG domain-containing protein [Streptomyces melanogenes]|uniref:LamG domain-containing protein n=1 Tax=Streptomyces melanogenes TaxID=67326 RepID=UPI001E3B50F8|nr:LamG domain-containing protein [Streptomyces melanogenes]